jgi:formate hydrogenlyase subunit 4
MTLAAGIYLAIAFVAAPLLPAIINRVKARFAGRRGQPLLQPYYDLAKLLRKEAVYGIGTTWIFRAGPVVCLAAVITATLLLPLGGERALVAFRGDLVVFAYLLALSRVAPVFAALDTGSSFEGMGASRETAFGALAEPALVLGLAAVTLVGGGVSMSAFLHPLWTSSSATLLLVVGALAVVFLAENARIPVDDPNTHLELTMIHEVMVLDHGGPDLAYIHYAAALKMWVLGALIVGLVVPQPDRAWVAGALALAGIVGVAVVTGLIESLFARLRMDAVPQFLLAGSTLGAVAMLLELR